jgi:hypothetical protein
VSRFTDASTGTPGPQGPPGDTPDLSSYVGDILPAVDNAYTLGNSDYRWKSISIGEGTIFITDATLGTEAGLTIDNGVFFINGVAQAQLPNIAVTNLNFNDNTTQTTAAVAQVNSDWNATTGKAQILNKPDLSSVGVPVEVDYVVGGGTSGTQPVFNGTPLFDGSYVKHGPLVYFRVNIDMSNITQFGSGQYYVTLPFNAKYDTYISSGHLHKYSNAKEYSIHGDVVAGSNRLNLYYTNSNGQEDEFTQSSPIGLAQQDVFHIAGSYISE